ncbi:MAG TPA: hypothetical protein VGB78_04790, partial [Thermoplasmata archaeon]
VQGATMGAQLNAFAGVFCFIVSGITPMLVKHSAKFASGFSKLLPRSLKFSGTVISRTLGKIVLPSNAESFKGAKATAAVLAAFVVVSISVLATDSVPHIILSAVGLGLAGVILVVTRIEVTDVVMHVNYSNLGILANDRRPIVFLVTGLVFGTALAVLAVVFAWDYAWQVSLLAMVAYVAFIVLLMERTYRLLRPVEDHAPPKVYHIPREDNEESDPIPSIPKPVYGGVRASPEEVRL